MKEDSLGGEPSFVSRVTTDRARVAAVRRRFEYRYAYELACCYFWIAVGGGHWV